MLSPGLRGFFLLPFPGARGPWELERKWAVCCALGRHDLILGKKLLTRPQLYSLAFS
jgi:hypothetical protein